MSQPSALDELFQEQNRVFFNTFPAAMQSALQEYVDLNSLPRDDNSYCGRSVTSFTAAETAAEATYVSDCIPTMSVNIADFNFEPPTQYEQLSVVHAYTPTPVHRASATHPSTYTYPVCDLMAMQEMSACDLFPKVMYGSNANSFEPYSQDEYPGPNVQIFNAYHMVEDRSTQQYTGPDFVTEAGSINTSNGFGATTGATTARETDKWDSGTSINFLEPPQQERNTNTLSTLAPPRAWPHNRKMLELLGIIKPTPDVTSQPFKIEAEATEGLIGQETKQAPSKINETSPSDSNANLSGTPSREEQAKAATSSRRQNSRAQRGPYKMRQQKIIRAQLQFESLDAPLGAGASQRKKGACTNDAEFCP